MSSKSFLLESHELAEIREVLNAGDIRVTDKGTYDEKDLDYFSVPIAQYESTEEILNNQEIRYTMLREGVDFKSNGKE